MSRSRKRHAWVWISKPWTNFMERSFRRRVKQECHDIEIDFDPDRDFDEAHLQYKKMGEWGTKCGINSPRIDDTVFNKEHYKEMLRK